jgi:hypothetical protein
MDPHRKETRFFGQVEVLVGDTVSAGKGIYGSCRRQLTLIQSKERFPVYGSMEQYRLNGNVACSGKAEDEPSLLQA